MRFNHLDLNLYVVLDALLTERSVTRAGQKLNLSQSGTSGALARLREQFKDELLVQVGRHMVLTPLGEMLQQPVRDILLQIEATMDKIPVFDISTYERKFLMIMSDYTTTVLMPEVIRIAKQVAPKIQFEILPPMEAPSAELSRGNVDFLVLPREFMSDEHPSAPLFQEDFVCVGAADNQALHATLTQDQYLELGHVLVRFGQQHALSMDKWLVKHVERERRVELVVPSFDAVPRFLLGSDRVATLHRRLANLWCSYLPLKAVPVPFAIPPVDWCMQWHQFRDNDPATLWLRGLIASTAASHHVLQHTETASLFDTLNAQRNPLHVM